MNFHVEPMQETHAALICAWHYEPPYQIYSFLPWEHMKALEVEFGDSEIRRSQYAVIMSDQHTLEGFAQFFPMEGVTRLGLGMNPERMGQGYGVLFVQAIVGEALQRTPHHEIDLEVLTWNERAIHIYKKVGFEITDTYERPTPTGIGQFHCMVYRPHSR